MSKKAKHPAEWDWSEKKFQNNFTSFLRNHDILNYKAHGGQFGQTGGNYSAKSGWSDLIIAIDERTLFVELKRHAAHLHYSQIVFFDKMIELNQQDNLFIFYADQWPEFKKQYAESKDFYKALSKSATKYYTGLDMDIQDNINAKAEQERYDAMSKEEKKAYRKALSDKRKAERLARNKKKVEKCLKLITEIKLKEKDLSKAEEENAIAEKLVAMRTTEDFEKIDEIKQELDKLKGKKK